ncbi:MAG TPA: MGMT family protein, partial [Trinickia sp.]|nr:MGMT family protein [Trinickia sp.]
MFNAVIEAPFGKVGIDADVKAGVIRAIVFLEPTVANVAPDSALAERAARQIERYLANASEPFDLPLAHVGTPFQRRVWQAMCEIPPGEVRTYGQ